MPVDGTSLSSTLGARFSNDGVRVTTFSISRGGHIPLPRVVTLMTDQNAVTPSLDPQEIIMTEATQTSPAAHIDAGDVVALKARMPHPAFLLDGGLDALTGLGRVARSAGVPEALLHMLCLRASQINGCSWCVVDHAREMTEDGASTQRIHAVAAWRDAPYFTERERVALEFTEEITRLADRPDPISDGLWSRMTAQFDRRQIAALLFEIGAINVWNRINAAVRQPAGQR